MSLVRRGWEENGLKRLYYWKNLEVHLEVWQVLFAVQGGRRKVEEMRFERDRSHWAIQATMKYLDLSWAKAGCSWFQTVFWHDSVQMWTAHSSYWIVNRIEAWRAGFCDGLVKKLGRGNGEWGWIWDTRRDRLLFSSLSKFSYAHVQALVSSAVLWLS